METFKDADGVAISYRRWLPGGAARAIVLIAHGASEHSGRYDRFASALTERGYAVYANDHRGHGATAAATGVGIGGPRGWLGLVEDLAELGGVARNDLGALPLVLFGHSMGSFASQQFAQLHGDTLAGLVLSGSAGAMGDLDAAIAGLTGAASEFGNDAPAATFAALNAAFEPARTPYDWLSRDPSEVDAYIRDEMCGDDAPLTIGFVLDMMRNLNATWTPEGEARVPKDLPVLFITGEADPVSGGALTVRMLEERYRANGVADVTALYYPDARHELLNETNRDAVTDDVTAWLHRVTAA